MVASVIEIVTGSATSGTSCSATMTTTPAAGDVLIAIVANDGNLLTSGVSGCGATWTKLLDHQSGLAALGAHSASVWAGVGASTAGAVTATLPSSTRQAMRVFWVRGTNATTVSADFTTGTGTLAGPAVTGVTGQLLINELLCYPSGTQGVTHAPATGWTDQVAATFATYFRTLSAWTAATGDTYSSTWSGVPSNASSEGVAIQVVVGNSAATHETTLSVGAAAGLAFTASSVAVTTLATGATVGLGFDATSDAPTTLVTPVGVGLGFTAEHQAPTTLAAGATVGLGFDAHIAVNASSMALAIELPALAPPTAAFDAYQPLRTAPNNVGGRRRIGSAEVVYDPPVEEPPS